MLGHFFWINCPPYFHLPMWVVDAELCLNSTVFSLVLPRKEIKMCDGCLTISPVLDGDHYL